LDLEYFLALAKNFRRVKYSILRNCHAMSGFFSLIILHAAVATSLEAQRFNSAQFKTGKNFPDF
jgi:hypothetical protein